MLTGHEAVDPICAAIVGRRETRHHEHGRIPGGGRHRRDVDARCRLAVGAAQHAGDGRARDIANTTSLATPLRPGQGIRAGLADAPYRALEIRSRPATV